MYFIPRGNKYYIMLAQMKTWKRWFFGLLIPVVIIFLWLIFVYFRLESSIQVYTFKKRNIENQLDLVQKSEGEVKRLTKIIKDLRSKFKNHSAFKSKNNFNVIIKHANVAGVELTSCSDNGMCKKEWYAQKNITIDIRGTLEQIKEFFKKINESCHLCGCLQFTLTHIDEDLFQAQCS